MKEQGGKKNENKKCIIDLLKNLSSYKYRSIDGHIDLFFSSIDLFIHLSKKESIIFEEIILKSKSIKEASKVFGTKYKLEIKQANKEINSFLKNLSVSIKNE